MKNLSNFYFFLFIFFMENLKVDAQLNQSKWQIGANAGYIVYQGDLTPKLLGNYKTLKPTVGINISRILSNALKLRTALSLGKISGNEIFYSKPAFRQERNLKFSTPITEISEILIYNFLDKSYKRQFSPYVFAGVGVSFLNIIRFPTDTSTIYLENETNAALQLSADLQTSLPKKTLVLAAGFGVEYNISTSVSLNAEMNFRYTGTDYLDGFSKVANPKSNDQYYSSTLGITYHFKKKGMLDCPVLKF